MELDPTTVTVLVIAFAWSGFVRAGLGFGGAGLMYPVALLVVDSVLFLVPIVCVHVLLFSTTTLLRDYRLVNWPVLRWLVLILFVPFMIGVLGLINLPEFVVLMMVYAIIITYALAYLLDVGGQVRHRWVDFPAMLLGGYVSGLSLAGAPLIAAIAARRLPREQFRATLFVLWPLLVIVKLATLVAFDVDLQLRHQWWLLPSAIVGHMLGMRVHDHLLTVRTERFYRWLGAGLLAISLTGLVRHLAG